GEPAVFPRSSSIIGKPLIWLSTTSITASFDRYHTLWITTDSVSTGFRKESNTALYLRRK
ncbi:MAG: hypothetical protein LBG87_01185, partial [Spirochaetaceae bacterium]|nr:hypothetical protein [Spirochaetaceae bacterium]